MDVKIRCDVCFDKYSLDIFRFLPTCGHGLCIACTEQTAANATCVICRHPKRNQQPVQIFMTFAGEPTSTNRAHNLQEIGPHATPISAKKAGKLRKTRHVVKELGPENEVAGELLDAAEGLDECVYPLLLELDLAKQEITTLTGEIEELKEQLAASGSLERKVQSLRRSISEAKVQNNALVAFTVKAKQAALKEQAQNARLSRRVERKKSELQTKEEEKEELRAKITRRDNRISLLESLVESLLKHDSSLERELYGR